MFSLTFARGPAPLRSPNFTIGIRALPTRGSAPRGSLKVPRVGWEIDDFWGFEWVFLDLNTHSVPTRCVGVFEIAWEISVIFSKSTYISLLIVCFSR